MAISSLRFPILLLIAMIFANLCISDATINDGIFTLSATHPPSPSTPTQSTPQQPQAEHSLFSHSALLPPILSHLGFNELSRAAPSLSDSPGNGWIGPSTLFAPSDASLHSCYSCSIPDLLREHIVPGLFTIEYLLKLSFGTKVETLSPGRCITITSDRLKKNSTTPVASKIFIGGVEITHPDLFNNGFVVIHGIQGYISPLSSLSCEVDKMTSLSFPFHLDRAHQIQPSIQPTIMRLMLRDAMLRLRNSGYGILALAMKIKYPELATLTNMTVFTIDDASIFSGSQSYISNVRFHIVPNHLLTYADLEKLPLGTALPSLERGQYLVVTSAGGTTAAPIRINHVRIRVPDMIRNLKIVIHSLFLPFPHIHPVANSVFDGILGGGTAGLEHTTPDQLVGGTCDANLAGRGNCGVAPMPQVKQTVDIEDHHGL